MEEQIAQVTKYQYAGFWMRFWAYILDLIIIFSINGIVLIPFSFINDGKPIDIGFWTVSGIISTIVYFLYFLCMTKFFQQTLGKMIFGLKVIKEDHSSLKWNDLFFREVIGRFIHNVFKIFVFLYLFVAFTQQKVGIHDMIGNTRVIHLER